MVAVLKSSFTPNAVDEIIHGCKDLKKSLIINSNFV